MNTSISQATLGRMAAIARDHVVVLALFATTLFLSALLLFSVQPIFAKMVLPKLGGSPSVWAISMCFFQAVLLAGYCYAHALNRFLGARRAGIVHLPVLCIALLALPFGLPTGAEPPAGDAYLWLIGVLTVGVGLPFFAISANAPLLQAWFARSGHPDARDPYFLYGASNLGSLLALLGYPILIEPLLGLGSQAAYWSANFALLTAMIGFCAIAIFFRIDNDLATAPNLDMAMADQRIAWQQKGIWIGLAFVPSGLLVAFTTHLATDIASAPFLWVIPLAIFLATFILVFREKPLIPHNWLLIAQVPLVALTLIGLAIPYAIGWKIGAVAGFGAFFTTTMICHRELFNRRPSSSHLTEFYAWMSLGGVLGGIFTAIVAPQVFNTVCEYPILLVLGIACRPGLHTPANRYAEREKAAFGSVLALGVAILFLPTSFNTGISERSFFGIHRVVTSGDGAVRFLVHGTTVHGAQRLADAAGKPIVSPAPATYYYPNSPMAQGFSVARTISGQVGGGLSAGVVGLGAGSLACYAKANETLRYYEIDPVVAEIARNPKMFTFLSHCRPNADIVLGDARLTLNKEPEGKFDYLIIDAFASDSVPVHLLTREAIELYLSKLKPNGLLAMHISNRHLDLHGVAAATVGSIHGAHHVMVIDKLKKHDFDFVTSHVMFISKSERALAPIRAWPTAISNPPALARAWTDDYSDIVGALWRAYWKHKPADPK